MIMKNHEPPPFYLQQLETLMRLIPSGHPSHPEIESRLGRQRAGYQGERALIYPLSELDVSRYVILFNLRLPLPSSHYFQMDAVLLSPSFFTILEVKNLAGTSYYDSDFNQLIQTRDGKESALPDPIMQVERQRNHFKEWLPFDVPIERYVIATNRNGILRASEGHPTARDRVIRIEHLPLVVKELEKKHLNKCLSEEMVDDIAVKLIMNHEEYRMDVTNFFNITQSDLPSGVMCPACSTFAMLRKKARWFCPSCQHESKNAHEQTLHDYKLLWGDTISNREARALFRVDSRHVIHRLFKKMNLPHEGHQKRSHYLLKNWNRA